MTLDKARALLQMQVGFGDFYNRHGARGILAKVYREHGKAVVGRSSWR